VDVLVVIVRIELKVGFPVSGLKLNVASDGSPEQSRETNWDVPLNRVMIISNVVELPAKIVLEGGETVTLKSNDS